MFCKKFIHWEKYLHSTGGPSCLPTCPQCNRYCKFVSKLQIKNSAGLWLTTQLVSSQYQSIILDTSTNNDNWLDIHAVIQGQKGPETVLWNVCVVDNQTAEIIKNSVVKLHRDSGVSIDKMLSWRSDGCSAMLKTASLLKEETKRDFTTTHCSMHRLDLCVSTDFWQTNTFSRQLERCLRLRS